MADSLERMSSKDRTKRLRDLRRRNAKKFEITDAQLNDDKELRGILSEILEDAPGDLRLQTA